MVTEIPNGIKAWLQGLYENGIEKVNPDDHLVDYKPLYRGNIKLCDNILSFSLLPVVTCGGKLCDKCYDVKALALYPSLRVKRYVNTSMALYNKGKLSKLIIAQILNSKTCKTVRIHVGGDFFNKEYAMMWIRIKKVVNSVKPHIKFYTYTKSRYMELLQDSGINVVKSSYGKKNNYGTMEYVKGMIDKHGGVLCPVTIMKDVPEKFCGSKCNFCMNRSDVFFKIH